MSQLGRVMRTGGTLAAVQRLREKWRERRRGSAIWKDSFALANFSSGRVRQGKHAVSHHTFAADRNRVEFLSHHGLHREADTVIRQFRL